MNGLNENRTFTSFQRQDGMRGLPFYGEKGDFNFVVGRSQFTPGVSIKNVPLSDMSRKSDPGVSQFELNINMLKYHFKPGDRIRGIVVNSTIGTENGRTVVGKLDSIKVNRRDKTIKVFIRDPKTLEKKEIYVDTMERVFESYRALSFSQFVNS
jgi:hypothetical protein